MFSPASKRGGFFRLVACPVVDASHAALVAAHIIQDGFNDVRRDADLGHAGSRGAAQVMQSPTRQQLGLAIIRPQIFKYFCVETFLAAGEPGKAASPSPKTKSLSSWSSCASRMLFTAAEIGT